MREAPCPYSKSFVFFKCGSYLARAEQGGGESFCFCPLPGLSPGGPGALGGGGAPLPEAKEKCMFALTHLKKKVQQKDWQLKFKLNFLPNTMKFPLTQLPHMYLYNETVYRSIIFIYTLRNCPYCHGVFSFQFLNGEE